MNECRYDGRENPRLTRDHLEDCEDGACKGCLPCGHAHCRVCGKEHVDGSCVACTGEAREDLHAIRDMCRNLASEVIHRGVDSEAFALLAPAADPEAWGHITTSLKVGRLPVGYLRCDRCKNVYPCEKHADGELHPLFVLASWEDVWREALDHETDARASISEAARYLDQQLTYMAGYEHAPFEDFARDLRRCRNHLESVLHDGEQVEVGAACIKCQEKFDIGVPQHKCYRGRELPWSTNERPALAHEDGWACPRCKRWSNPEQYRMAVRNEHLDRAAWLTDLDMEERTGIKAGTVRSWARDDKPLIRKQRHTLRTVYSVDDVFATAREKGIETTEDTPPDEVVA